MIWLSTEYCYNMGICTLPDIVFLCAFVLYYGSSLIPPMIWESYWFLLHVKYVRNQGCNQLFGSHQFCPKKWGGQKQKSYDFLKKTYILLISYITCSVKQMLFRTPVYHQNKSEGVPFFPAISVRMYLYYLLYLLCVFVFICIFLCINT